MLIPIYLKSFFKPFSEGINLFNTNTCQLNIFLKIYYLDLALEWAEGIVGIAIARSVVVTVRRSVVAVVVITSSINTRVTMFSMLLKVRLQKNQTSISYFD